MRKFDLSILIINWNTREMLRDVLETVYRTETGRAAEVIVVDNASDDGSAEMVSADFPQTCLIRNTDNRGFAAANNQAMKVARGTYWLLLNSDTLLRGEVLRASLAYLDANPAVGAMGCRVLNADGTVQMTCSMFPSLLNLGLEFSGLWKLRWPKFLGRYHMTHWHRDTEREVDVISGCYLVIRRDVVAQVGLLDEGFFFFGEETDWCARIREAGWKLMLAPVGEITHYGGGSVKRLNHKRDLMLSEALVRLHRKHGGWWDAMLVAIIIFMFHLSRAVYWSLVRLITSSERARERSTHFLRIMGAGGTVWPKL